MAFDAVDADFSQTLDKDELLDIMREVADEMDVKAPSESDVVCVLRELD